MKNKIFLLFLFVLSSFLYSNAQANFNIEIDSLRNKMLIDSILKKNKINTENDTPFKSIEEKKKQTITKIHKEKKVKPPLLFFKDSTRTSAKNAAILGAMMPGLGQIYNRKYWKLPIVYGGIAGSIYWMASSVIKTKEYNGYLIKAAKNEPLPPQIAIYGISQIESIRNTHRRNVQLASFVTMMVWGFTIVDAAVDAHIRPFDISDKLSMQVKPSIHQYQNDNYFALSINLNLK